MSHAAVVLLCGSLLLLTGQSWYYTQMGTTHAQELHFFGFMFFFLEQSKIKIKI